MGETGGGEIWVAEGCRVDSVFLRVQQQGSVRYGAQKSVILGKRNFYEENYNVCMCSSREYNSAGAE